MLAPRAIVFDLDGTLIDSRGDIVAACNHALAETGRPTLSAAKIQQFVGDGARYLCARAAGLPERDPDVDAVLASFMAYYLAHPADCAAWMPHAREAVDSLRDLPLAVCTNKQRVVAEAVLEALGARSLFSVVIGGGDVPAIKPAPDGLLRIAATLGVDPRSLVMIGDGPQDVMAGRNAGCRTIAVTCGYAPHEAVVRSQPDALIETLAGAPAFVRKWQAGDG